MTFIFERGSRRTLLGRIGVVATNRNTGHLLLLARRARARLLGPCRPAWRPAGPSRAPRRAARQRAAPPRWRCFCLFRGVGLRARTRLAVAGSIASIVASRAPAPAF